MQGVGVAIAARVQRAALDRMQRGRAGYRGSAGCSRDGWPLGVLAGQYPPAMHAAVQAASAAPTPRSQPRTARMISIAIAALPRETAPRGSPARAQLR
jgi:hypothetical protein